MSAKFYTTWGSVRGSCGHKHRGERTAYSCVCSDHAGCARQGGYSDRHVYRVTIADDGTRDEQYVDNCESEDECGGCL